MYMTTEEMKQKARENAIALLIVIYPTAFKVLEHDEFEKLKNSNPLPLERDESCSTQY